jgi:hypothetical protein
LMALMACHYHDRPVHVKSYLRIST